MRCWAVFVSDLSPSHPFTWAELAGWRSTNLGHVGSGQTSSSSPSPARSPCPGPAAAFPGSNSGASLSLTIWYQGCTGPHWLREKNIENVSCSGGSTEAQWGKWARSCWCPPAVSCWVSSPVQPCLAGQSAANTRANAEKAAVWWCWSGLRASEGRNKWVTARQNKTQGTLTIVSLAPYTGGRDLTTTFTNLQPRGLLDSKSPSININSIFPSL